MFSMIYKIFYLEDAMVLYVIYNSETLETLIDTVYRLHNQSTWMKDCLWEK